MFEENITPATIATITFRVPLYQRPYAWEAKQVTQLLGDLYEAFQEGQTSGTHADYHIGILSIANTIDDKSRYDLIDGQQRITTLFLIGKAAQAHFPKWGEFLSSERLDLYGREADKRYLGGDDSAECNRRMVDAVRCANEFFDKDAADCGAFAEFIYEHAAFFLSEVPPTYELLDKNQQFVRMNNRGKQLEKHEILKVQLLSKIGAKDEQSKAFGIWNAMISCLTGIKNGQQDELKPLSAILGSEEKGSEAKNEEFLYTSMLTIPEFLLIALARSLGAEEAGKISFKTDNLLATFSVLASEASIIAFTEVLQKQVELFRSFFIFLSKQEKYEFGGMRDTDTEDKDFDFGDAKIRKPQLIATQSFLYVSTQPQHWMIPTFDWCEKQSRPIRSDEFIYELERIDKSITSQGKREVSPAIDFENMTYGSIRHYWFYRLDYELWKQFHVGSPAGRPDPIWSNLPKEQQNLIENFRFRRCGSVEHIVPRTTRDGPASLPPEISDSFGNLALISSSRNSKFSNDPTEGKKAIILQSSQPYTESLKMLHFLWCYPKPDPKNHGEAMLGVLKDTARQ